MIELIGTNAGLVWNVLNEGGKMSFKAVQKATLIKANHNTTDPNSQSALQTSFHVRR